MPTDAIEIARYQFHCWSRKGISANIAETDDLGAGTSTQLERAEVPVGVLLNGNAQSKNFLLIGPGDIIGVNPNMIVRTEPLNWITNFEPNYLSFLEFYDEDFAWRYTPAAPSGVKLRPWLLLLVLKQEEFSRGAAQVPLPTITVKTKTVFPPLTDSPLWAHMHSNSDIPDSELNDYEQFLRSLNQTMNADPDQLYCRLLCPRKLEPNTAYNVFLVPAFETGRLAGLQQDPSAMPAQMASWDANGAKGDMPVYFEWYFRTGESEDFEYLVKLLEPRPMDSRVGIRDMDCSRPGFLRAEDASQELPGTSPAILGLEGALRSPDTVSTVFPAPPASNAFQVELQKITNLPATIVGQSNSKDPVISVPIYGSNHAKQSSTDVVTLDITNNHWLNDLNRDPRTRVAGGLGTLVVQSNQSAYLKDAWAQVDGIVTANKKIKASVFLMKVALQATVKTFMTMPKERLLAVGKPLLSRVMGSPTTLYQQLRQSNIPVALLSGGMRRLVRPAGKLLQKLAPAGNLTYPSLVQGFKAGRLSTAPLNALPAGLPNTKTIATQITASVGGSPSPSPAWLTWLEAHKWIMQALAALFLLLAVVTGSWAFFLALAAAAVAGYAWLGRAAAAAAAAAAAQSAAGVLSDPQQALASLESIPPQPAFSYQLMTDTAAPPPTAAAPGADSVEAANFRKAMADLDTRMALQVPAVTLTEFDVDNAHAKLSAAMHPYTSFPSRLSAQLRFPGYIVLTQPDKIFPAMAYPDIDDPMYAPLAAISQELLMPNIKLVPPNTISLVETNPPFIESYMVGLNHEMGRELLWQEYPTDERGSYFRQFWEVKGLIEPKSGESESVTTEEFKDIKPIDTWGFSTLLGSHNNRGPSRSTSPEAVLLIRGELLKRYPNTLIFVQKARAGQTPDEPVIDLTLTNQTFATEVRFPLYRADASPDIKFFGFDLTIAQARGTDLTPGFNDHLGWFFIIQEVPGEPRFGMDITFTPDSGGLTWDDLSWDLFNDPNMSLINSADRPTKIFPDEFRWGADSANMAYILFRNPSMVAVHASDMLDTLT